MGHPARHGKALSNHPGLGLVGGLEPWNFMTFRSVGNVIIPTDELIFFRGVDIPPTNSYGSTIII